VRKYLGFRARYYYHLQDWRDSCILQRGSTCIGNVNSAILHGIVSHNTAPFLSNLYSSLWPRGHGSHPCACYTVSNWLYYVLKLSRRQNWLKLLGLTAASDGLDQPTFRRQTPSPSSGFWHDSGSGRVLPYTIIYFIEGKWSFRVFQHVL
jgi:hypothetical protein